MEKKRSWEHAGGEGEGDGKKQKIAPLFMKRDRNTLLDRHEGVVLKNGWQSARDGHLLVKTGLGDKVRKDARKIAAFDFDGCLCMKQNFADMDSGAFELPRDLTYKVVENALKRLYEDGYRLVIFTNEVSIGRRRNVDAVERAIVRKTKRLDEFLEFMDIPFEVYLSTKYGKYRKPSTKDESDIKTKSGGIGMWEVMRDDILKLGTTKNLDLEASFFVGDSAGRETDDSDCDIRFARQVGIRFYTTEEFFRDDKGPIRFYDPCSSSSLSKSRIRIDHQVATVLVMVGLPGSGKTTLAKNIVDAIVGEHGDRAGVRFSQDQLGTREKVEAQVRDALIEGKKLIIVDRTNANGEQRDPWIRLAKTHGARCIVVVVDTPLIDCVSRCVDRRDHEGKGFPSGPENKKKIEQIIMRLQQGSSPVDVQAETGIDSVVTYSGPQDFGSILQVLGKPNASSSSLSPKVLDEPASRAEVMRRFVLTSLSTDDFCFDVEKAASVIQRCATRFLQQHRHKSIELILVECKSDELVRILKEKAVVRDSRFRVEKAETVFGECGALNRRRKAAFIALGCNFRFKPGGDLINSIVHAESGKGEGDLTLEQLTMQTYGAGAFAEVAKPYSIAIPKSHRLFKEYGIRYVVQVLGPNMNPERKHFLGDSKESFEHAMKQLELAYMNLFQELWKQSEQVVSMDTVEEKSENKETEMPSIFVVPPRNVPIPTTGYLHALKDYTADPDATEPRFEQRVLVRDLSGKSVVIFDAYPKARVHLLVLPMDSSRLGKLNSVREFRPTHLSELIKFHDLARRVVEWLKAQGAAKSFRIGYHAIPSLYHLHLHLISEDFDSPCMKTKKHWNSFTQDEFFIQADVIEDRLKLGKADFVHDDKQVLQNVLKRDLCCFRCKQAFLDVPALKQHNANECPSRPLN